MSTVASLKYRAIDFGRAEITGVTAQRALDGGQLIFGLRLFLKAKPPGERITIHGVSGTLQLESPTVLVGTIAAFNSIREETTHEDHECFVSVFSHLSGTTIRALDLLHATASAVNLQLRLMFDCTGSPGPDSAQAWMDREFSQAAWNELLKEFSFEDRHTIEIPISGGRVSGSFTEAAEHYRRALLHLSKHEWVAATTEARKTTESIRNVLNLQQPANAEWGQPSLRAAWNLGQRIEHARASIHNIFHLANHPGVTDDPGPHQARLAVDLAGILLRYYSSRHT